MPPANVVRINMTTGPYAWGSIDLSLYPTAALATIVHDTPSGRVVLTSVPLGGVVAQTQVTGTLFEYKSDGRNLQVFNGGGLAQTLEITILFG